MESQKPYGKKYRSKKGTPAKRKSARPGKKGRDLSGQTGIKDFASNISLIENRYYGVCLVEVDTLKLVFANSYFRKRVGYTKRELEGFNLLKLIAPEDQMRLAQTIRARIRGNPVGSGNRYTAVHKNGSRFIVEVYSSPVLHQNRICLQGIVQDVSEKVELEKNLQESESRFKSFFELSPEAVLTLDKNGKVSAANKAVEKLTGYKESRLVGKLFNRLPIWSPRSGAEAINVSQLIEKKPTECLIKAISGDIKYVEMFASKIPLEGGEHEVLLIARDITARKQYEDKLVESEKRHKALVNNILDGIAVAFKGKYIYIDPKFARIFGYSVDELKGRSLTKILSKKDKKYLSSLESRIWRDRQSPKQMELSGRKKDGSHIYLDLRASRIGFDGKHALQVTVTDITPRKNAEMRLQESEERLKTIFHSIDDSIFVIDKKGRFVHFEEPGGRKLLYKDAAQILGKDVNKIVSPEIARSFEKIFREISQKRATVQKEYSINIAGRQKWFSTKISPLCDDQGNFGGVTIVARDMTDSVQASRELKHERDLTRSILDTANSLIVCLDHKGRITTFNRECELVTGYRRENVIGKSWAQLFLPKSHRHKGLENFAAWVKRYPHDRYEGPLITKSGEIKTILWSNSSITGQKPDDFVAIAIGHDITERKLSEELLRESEIKYRSLVDNVGIGIALISPAMRILSINNQIKKWFPHIDLSKQPKCYEIFGNPPRRELCDGCPAVLSLEDGLVHEGTTETLAGDRLSTYRTVSSPIKDKAGRITAVIEMIEDITQRKQAEEAIRRSEEKYRTLVESAGEAISMIDREGRFLLINTVAARRLGGKPDDFTGKTMWDAFPQMIADRQMSSITKVIESGEGLVEEKLTILQGEQFWYQTSIQPLPDPDGKINSALIIATDVSARKQADEEIRKFKTIADRATYGTAISDLDGKLVYLNEYYAKMHGYSAHELIGKHLSVFYSGEQLQGVNSLIERLIRAGSFTSEEVWHKHRDGSVFPTLMSATVIKDDMGCPIYLSATALDITERKRAEEALREGRRWQRAILSNIPDMAWLKDKESRYIAVNEQFGKECGVSPEDLVGKNDLDIWPRELALKYRADDKEVMVKGQRKRIEEPLSDMYGKIKILETIKTPIYNDKGEIIGTTGIARDITERKQAEEALRVSQERMISIFNGSRDAIFITGLDTKFKDINEAAEILTGYSKEELLKMSIPDLHDQEDLHAYERFFRRIMNGESISSEADIRRKDGTKIPTQFSNKRIFIGDTPYMHTTARDITEHKKAEEALKNERDRLYLVFENLPVMAIAFDQDLNIIACNKACEKVTGYKKAELIANPQALSILCPNPKYCKQIIKMLRGETMGQDSWEWHIRSNGGEDRIIAWTSVSSKISVPGYATWGVGLDVTDTKKAEMALKNQRDMLRDVTEDVIKVQEDERRRISMELHDSIGQSLSIIRLQIQNIIKSVQNDDRKVVEGLEAVSNAVMDTVSDLRQISANLRPLILDHLGLWPTIEWYLKDFGKKANLAMKIDITGAEPNLSPHDEVHIFRIIQEIMINIQKHSKAHGVSFKSGIKDSELVFEINEDGRGFDPDRIFEPSGRRRGMGLINIMERVNIVKGRLDIRSAPDEGAKFIVSVPIKCP